MKKQLKSIDSSYDNAVRALRDIVKQQKKLLEAAAAYKAALDVLAAQISETEVLLDSYADTTQGNGRDQLLDATKLMQETQMSFNLQYLQLQSQMQHENRSYTAVSNIMKTKHDTVKNSISNVR